VKKKTDGVSDNHYGKLQVKGKQTEMELCIKGMFFLTHTQG